MNLEKKIINYTQEISLENKLYQNRINHIKSDFIEFFESKDLFETYKYTLNFYHQLKKTRITGEPQVIHPLRTAIFLKKNNTSLNSIHLGFLHDIVEDAFTEKLKEFNEYNLQYWSQKVYQNKEPKKIEKTTYQLYQELVEPNTKNKELNEIENLLGNKIKEYVKLISFKYYIPKDEINTEYNLDKYKNYIEEIIKYSSINNDLIPIQAKIADRWDNSKTIQGLDASKIERTLLKNEILIKAIYNEMKKDLVIDKTTNILLNNLKKILNYEKQKDYTKTLVTKKQTNKLNKITDNSVNIIELTNKLKFTIEPIRLSFGKKFNNKPFFIFELPKKSFLFFIK